MARPRVIKLDNGVEIMFKNASPELVEGVKAFLSGKAPTEAPKESTPPVKVAAPKSEPMTNLAIGMSLKEDYYYVDVVRYSVNSKQGELVSQTNVGREQIYANERFKIAVAENEVMA